jgi:hypothetical protein
MLPTDQRLLQQAVEAVARHGTKAKAALALKIPRTTLNSRLEAAQRRLMEVADEPFEAAEHPARIAIKIRDGVAIVGSDAHYWPNIVSTAHRAFVRLCEKLEPDLVDLNGDVLDGARISRHAPIGWEDRPALIEEIEACKDRTGEIVKATLKKKTRRVWGLGNHDARFETRLATVAPEYAKVHGVHLKDHFPDWEPCWSVWINDDVVIKHRFKGGIHATHNNTVSAGKSMATGHLHSLKVTPFTDYGGTRFGIDTGTLAQAPTKGSPVGPQFMDYLEDNPVNWRSGFVVLTFRGGRLMWPEVCHVIDEKRGLVEFRGELMEV